MTEPAVPSDSPAAARPVHARPLRARVLAIAVTVVFLVGPVIGWFQAPAAVRAGFNAFQVGTLVLLIFVLLFLLWLLAGSSVHADGAGVTARNGFRTRRVDWGRVARIVMPPGGPWARLVLHEVHAAGPDEGDPVVVRLMGLTPSDGRRSRVALVELRRLLDAARDADAPEGPAT